MNCPYHLPRQKLNLPKVQYSLGQKFRTFKWDFFLASMEVIGKLWKWCTV